MLIGFNNEFTDKIIAGTKIHTIRDDIKNRWRAGMTMHMSTGVRTKQYNCFKLDVCSGAQNITIIHYPKKAVVFIDDQRIGVWNKVYENTYFQRIKDLAKNDGFDTTADFFSWFDTNYTGRLIHWTDLRY